MAEACKHGLDEEFHKLWWGTEPRNIYNVLFAECKDCGQTVNDILTADRKRIGMLKSECDARDKDIADQAAEIERLRDALEKLPTLTLDDDPDSPFEKGFSYPGCILCSVKDKFARQALDKKE